MSEKQHISVSNASLRQAWLSQAGLCWVRGKTRVGYARLGLAGQRWARLGHVTLGCDFWQLM